MGTTTVAVRGTCKERRLSLRDWPSPAQRKYPRQLGAGLRNRPIAGTITLKEIPRFQRPNVLVRKPLMFGSLRVSRQQRAQFTRRFKLLFLCQSMHRLVYTGRYRKAVRSARLGGSLSGLAPMRAA